MNIPMENSTASPMELDIGHTVESFQQFLESQKDLFHSQIDQLEKIVVTQCKLTGVNPLSQEMAAGALSIKIGKRPRDLLNPKAVKYMQSVFSIKDTISKKETREISALCGVTVTQVREFFAGQRSRVRKVVRLSREKAIRFSACKTSDDGSCVKSESDVPVSHETSSNSDQQNVKEEETSLNPDHKIIKDAETFLNLEHKNVKDAETFLNSEHKNVKDAETCSTSQEETIPGLDSSENFFVENIFNLMRKEDTFSGQVKLLQSILRIHNSAVLNWFLTKGGMMILAKWLSEAALEEQTTVLLVILKVLCRLPLHKALPAQMSAILQTVNRLRFYRTSDISNRAKVLLSRWSKLFVRSQALKKLSPANARSDAQKEMIHNQRISEILGDNSWQSKLEIPLFSLNENFSKSCRKLENAGAVKLLPPPSCDSNKKSSRNITSSNNKERRKVQLVEQPSRNVARSGSVAKMASVKHSRPMSADDIQKAKMRAIFMQSKYALRGESSTHNNQQKTETSKISSDISECQKNCSSITNNKLGDAKTSMMEKQQDQKPASVLICQTLPPTEYITDPQSSLALQHADLQSNACQNDNVLQPSCAENIDLKPSVAPQEHDFEPTVTLEGPDLKLKSVLQEPNSKSCMACEVSDLMLHSGLEEKLLWERLKKVQIPWHMPPEIRVSSQWSLGAGENSKEIEVQTERIRREKETVYQSNQDIPSDPKEPWDVEMDYDDSLTPEIPTEQPPDGQSEASPEAPSTDATSDVTSATAENSKTPEPDLELLAVLLKNPDLVFALTSSQGSSISNGQIVQVLDMLKASGLSGSVNGLAVNGAEQQKSILSQNPVSPSPPTPLSLPSPTPASLPSPTPDPSSRWSFDSAMTLKVPGMTRISQPVVAGASTALSPVPSYAASMPNLVSHQAPVSVASVPERSVSTRSLPPQSSVSAPPWKEVPPEVPKVYQEASIAARPLATVTQLTQNASSTLQQFPAQRLGAANHGRPGNTVLAPVSLGMNHPPMERPVTTYSLPSTASTAPRTQQAFPELMPYSPQYTPWSRNYPQISTQESPSEPGHSRANGFASNRASNAHFVANQSNYNAYLAGPSEPVFETWSPERAIPQAQPDGNFSTRRNSGWSNERTERSRHNNNQAQRWGSRTGNKRWHERGRRY
ncbi:homeobox protein LUMINIDEPENDENS-like isoform X2 [Aristolochia californica]|uniref:homeobox protein LUMINIDEPENDENS-like isoform X2 n=1 Tax=Aristolochia californica TaxID=171875 RepID=UPI0035D5F66C